MPLNKYLLKRIFYTISFISITFAIVFALKFALKLSPNILSYDSEILLPFTYGISGSEEYLKKESLHPLMIGLSAFVLMNDWNIRNDNSKLELARKHLNFLADEYPHIENMESYALWKYPVAWRELQPGWYSGLANSCIALAFLTGYQVFGDSKYEQLAFKAINGVIRTIKDGGCAVEIADNSHWFEEYAWQGLTKNNAYFVNNGFLVALLTVKLFAEQTNNKTYKDAFIKGLNAFKQTVNTFYFDGEEWTYYMLNPKEIETPSYAVYDLVIYRALHKLTSHPAFKEQVNKREEILKKTYPILFFINTEGETNFIFSTIGPPHPYLLDKTKLRVSFFCKNDTICSIFYGKDRKDQGASLKDKIFISGRVDYDAIAFEIASQTITGDYVRWYNSNLKTQQLISEYEAEPRYIPYDLNCAYDAAKSSVREILVDPAIVARPDSLRDYTNNIAVAILQLKQPIDVKLFKYFGLLARPAASTKSIGINIYDSENRVSGRYYVPLKENVDNLILLNKLGFTDIAQINDSIYRIDLVVYTSELADKFNILFSDILLFQNEKELYSYFTKNVFHFPHQF